MSKTLYLASASPRRQQLLRQLAVDFKTIVADIDETPYPKEAPAQFVTRMAKTKANTIQQQLFDENAVILAADTIVVVEQQIFGKPKDQSDSRLMLKQLSGRCHQVLSAIAIQDKQQQQYCLNTNKVWFRALKDAEILQYWQTGEPQGKAGSYAVQGHGASFIEKIEGSYSGIMGIPLYETSELLLKFNINFWINREAP